MRFKEFITHYEIEKEEAVSYIEEYEKYYVIKGFANITFKGKTFEVDLKPRTILKKELEGDN